MNTTTSAHSPDFEGAVVRTLSLLELLINESRQLDPVTVDEYDRLRFEGLILLTSHRGLHLIDIDAPVAPILDRSADLEALLRAAHAQLIDQLTGREDFGALEFVAEVGAICQEVTDHAHSH